jgi:hypothetical protein
MTYISHRVFGQPYGKGKVLGNLAGPPAWLQDIVDQTAHLPRVADACMLRVTFLLHANRFPSNCPYGPDLDNLLKLFLDGLNSTVFSQARGLDSCVVSLEAMKTRVASEDEAGAQFEILPVNVAIHRPQVPPGVAAAVV